MAVIRQWTSVRQRRVVAQKIRTGALNMPMLGMSPGLGAFEMPKSLPVASAQAIQKNSEQNSLPASAETCPNMFLNRLPQSYRVPMRCRDQVATWSRKGSRESLTGYQWTSPLQPFSRREIRSSCRAVLLQASITFPRFTLLSVISQLRILGMLKLSSFDVARSIRLGVVCCLQNWRIRFAIDFGNKFIELPC